ncbi:jg7597, partial [Pararge aegeria aegeria]
ITADGEKELSLFIKKQIPLEKIKVFDCNVVYRKELFIYTELIKVMTLLQDKAGVPSDDRFKLAKAYKGSSVNALIFENLTKKGFKTYGRLDLPPVKYLELAVKELAKFHGISFVMEHYMPEFYESKIKSINNQFNYNEDWKELMKKVYLYTANLLGGEIKRKIEDFLPIAIDKYPKYDKDQTTVRCCLTHMDYRPNNVLVRESNGEPVEVMVVDFQLMDYGCPLKDFLFFIYASTSREFRAKHLDDLKDLYFETLSRFLKYFELDVDDVYPRKEFEKVYKDWMDYGLIRTLYASVFLFAPDTGLDVSNLSLAELPFNPDRVFEERARGWLEDFIEGGYL